MAAHPALFSLPPPSRSAAAAAREAADKLKTSAASAGSSAAQALDEAGKMASEASQKASRHTSAPPPPCKATLPFPPLRMSAFCHTYSFATHELILSINLTSRRRPRRARQHRAREGGQRRHRPVSQMPTRPRVARQAGALMRVRVVAAPLTAPLPTRPPLHSTSA